MDAVVLERFSEGLPARTSAWVRYHRPETLEEAVELAESHLAPPSPSPRSLPPTPRADAAGPSGPRRERPTPALRARWLGGGPNSLPLTRRRALGRQGRHVGGAANLATIDQVVRVAGRLSPPPAGKWFSRRGIITPWRATWGMTKH